MFLVNPTFRRGKVRLMLDDVLPRPRHLRRFLDSANDTETTLMSSLLDQSVLTDLAERLVAAARRAGADAADALAVRGMSLAVEVREGAVEESERSEGDDVGLRVFVGRRQAVVSTNDIKADTSELAERAV